MVAPLNQRNAHPRDESVTFEAEGHRYLIQGSSEGVISVTTLLGEFFPKFDPDAVIDKYYTRWQQNSYKKPECYNKTKDEIKEMWRADGDKAKEEGTRLHQAIEAYYNNDEEVEYDQSRKEWKQFQAFQEEHKLEAYRTEMILWSSKHKLGG
ncbi:expressed unknown protein [Seminavis robusta]|uniref:Uncharacterized protein n=1 Tax=Seminavis robusta TaxID=568900 RepID=A0A9N8D6X9_9STRA|nr:expressed unknown protein [Seminavis robusta]|eukprot:Sro21_g014700.1 n/a (152) ;mRNA; r:79850-80305